MTAFHLLAATALASIGVLHSVLGEHVILRPLFVDERWRVALGRRHAEEIIRFAWHATSLAWFGLAATVLGVTGPVAVAVVAAVSGTVGLVRVRWHLSWPVFCLAAVWAALAAGVASRWLPVTLVAAAVLVAIVAAGLHLVWATGRARTSAAAALPTAPDGSAVLRSPSTAITVAVALALTIYAGALAALLLGASVPLARVVVAGAVVVLAVRAAGDGRYVGFSKRVRSTAFARLDDAIYTPIAASLAIGGVAGLAL